MKKILDLLKNAPRAQQDFKEIIQIANSLERRSSVDDYFLEVCLRHNIIEPYAEDSTLDGVFFRPYLIGKRMRCDGETTHPCFRADNHYQDNVTFPYNPWEEQAYRRGYDQGYRNSIEEKGVNAQQVHEWRKRPVQILGSPPGDPEKDIIYPDLTNKRDVPLRLRYRIMSRDGYRCQLCGITGSEERLEIDHRIPISKGGSNSDDNLWTLCFPCNRGKADNDL